MSSTTHANGDSGGAPISSGAKNSALDGAETFIEIASVSSAVEDKAGESRSVRASPAGQKPEERFGMKKKNAMPARKEELQMQAVRSMADFAKRKLDALEEQNEIAAFSRSKATELPETSQCFAALCKAHLAKALKRTLVTSSEMAAVENVENDDSSTVSGSEA